MVVGGGGVCFLFYLLVWFGLDFLKRVLITETNYKGTSGILNMVSGLLSTEHLKSLCLLLVNKEM